MAETDKQDSTAETADVEAKDTERTDEELTDEEQIELAEDLFRKTNNSIFVWRAIYFATEAKICIPDWCLPYLNEVSQSIKEASESACLNNHEEEEKIKNRENIKVFLRNLPNLLKFTSNGKNAFREFVNIDRLIHISAYYKGLKEGIACVRDQIDTRSKISFDAMSLLMARLHIEDERHLRRLISRGKKLYFPVEYDEPEG